MENDPPVPPAARLGQLQVRRGRGGRERGGRERERGGAGGEE